MANTATRLLNLIMLLQREPNTPASRLAEALDVSVRTVQRYITMLEEMGVPVYAERGSQGGYSLVRGYRMPPLVLSPEEAVAVSLGTSVISGLWGNLFRTSAQSAMTKIANVLPEEQLREVRWAQDSLLTRGLPRANPSVNEPSLETLYQASRRHQQLDIVYQGRGRVQAQSRRIDPYALIYSWGQQYCVAYCHLRGAMRSFRIDRILSLQTLESHFDKPTDFDPSKYLNQATDDRPMTRVSLLFAAEHADLARDYACCWDTLEEREDGSWLAEYSTADLDMARCRVMSFAPKAQVLGPPELIEKIQQAALAVLAQYPLTSAATGAVPVNPASPQLPHSTSLNS
ncbi:helix-turn-helix transcriptional regulator [Gilvimarinus polysaccharolyticus]|uniref:helix-turn-helix transcriptional regulator n=1 Tax=Gilvimarinus polysaccharolyticus TaxID=863921 RepID=UPI000673B505|nr:YafY family protein [Gilvimarinus polysaccharolyticus]